MFIYFIDLFESQDVLGKRNGPDTITPFNLLVDSWPGPSIATTNMAPDPGVIFTQGYLVG